MKGEKIWECEDRDVVQGTHGQGRGEDGSVEGEAVQAEETPETPELGCTHLPAKLPQPGVLTSQGSQPGSEGSGGSWR